MSGQVNRYHPGAISEVAEHGCPGALGTTQAVDEEQCHRGVSRPGDEGADFLPVVQGCRLDARRSSGGSRNRSRAFDILTRDAAIGARGLDGREIDSQLTGKLASSGRSADSASGIRGGLPSLARRVSFVADASMSMQRFRIAQPSAPFTVIVSWFEASLPVNVTTQELFPPTVQGAPRNPAPSTTIEFW